MAKIAVLRSWYLPLSETFIYQELIRLRENQTIVCAKKLMNLGEFPYQPIYSYHTEDELIEILKKNRIELIHARFGTTGVEMLNVKKRCKVPMLTSFHGFDSPDNRKNKSRYKGVLKKLFEKGELFTVPSCHMRNILIKNGCPPQKIRVHYSGIDLEQFPYSPRSIPASPEPIQILTVGRLIPKKGTEYLLQAFQRVVKKHPPCMLHIVGDGPLDKKLKIMTKELGIEKKTKFWGALPHHHVADLFQKTHIFCLPSIRTRKGNVEGIPNVIKEAMAAGLPVVSTKHGGIPEIIKHGKTGLLVRGKDSKEPADALLKLIRHPETWESFGIAGRKYIEENFNSRLQVPKLEKLYRQLIN